MCHGTRTLASVVPLAAIRRQGLSPKKCHLSALGPGRRPALGRLARPALDLGLPATALVHYPTASRPTAIAVYPQSPLVQGRHGTVSAYPGTTPARQLRTAFAGLPRWQ